VKLTPRQLKEFDRFEESPFWLIAGSDPVLVGEVWSWIRSRMGQGGAYERRVFRPERTLDPGFFDDYRTASLFSERRLFEVHLPTPTVQTTGASALSDLLEEVVPATWLAVHLPGLDRGLRLGAFYTRFTSHGQVVECWPPDPIRWDAEVERRAREHGVIFGADGRELLTALTEGNLLGLEAALRILELDELDHPVTGTEVARVLGAGAHYGPFDLAEAALAGNPGRVFEIFQALDQASGEWPLMLGALVHEIHAVLGAQGPPAPPRKQSLYEKARRRGRPFWYRRLEEAARADLVIKGRKPGQATDRLLTLVLHMSGVPGIGERV
jgi:DNA polymerase-3 subunit delta